MVIGLILLGGIPYLDKYDTVKVTWTINNTVEMTWRGKRFGQSLGFKRFKRIYELRRHLFDMGKEQIHNMLFEEINQHIKELTERYYVVPLDNYVEPWIFKPDLATLNEITTKSGLHHLLLNGGEYDEPWLFKDSATTDCVRTIVTHTTAGTGSV